MCVRVSVRVGLVLCVFCVCSVCSVSDLTWSDDVVEVRRR